MHSARDEKLTKHLHSYAPLRQWKAPDFGINKPTHSARDEKLTKHLHSYAPLRQWKAPDFGINKNFLINLMDCRGLYVIFALCSVRGLYFANLIRIRRGV
jgi:hypothetical protein